MKPIISVEGLGKSYTIRHEGQTNYKSLREEIFKLPKRLLQRNNQNQEEFWALKDVSFDVMPGDRVGIIGRNGAGKSTLLKLLSRITEPTTGRITLRGRVASLLEVGTGFHPELTGRENIFLNGAILGMSRAEVRRKFDEIVDFAGVEKFLDTPVKRYSSGMYVRLAFAVAAHLEPEILIVDEVLAVGDTEFQKKCLGKMEEVGKKGRTILFVSHNMGMISKLCESTIFLQNGTIHTAGPTAIALGEYSKSRKQNASLRKRVDRDGTGEVRLTSIEFIDGTTSESLQEIRTGQIITVRLGLESNNNLDDAVFSFAISGAASGNDFFICSNGLSGEKISLRQGGNYVCCSGLKWPLGAGLYTIRIFCSSVDMSVIYDWILDAETITVQHGEFFHGSIGRLAEQDCLLVESHWE
ncbi:ABC transporter ATP-binding protein [Desulfovibrio falkowii]|uniref:ABC transporter domain-containing protein n=1 Tax=Desulfovibrio falkowii TaxID=3136602 RepID=A0ABQ0EB66_9BACT